MHPPIHRRWLWTALLALGVSACASGGAVDALDAAPRHRHPVPLEADDLEPLVAVLLVTGPRDGELTGTARQQAFAGHFANMSRLAERGDLLLAGPFLDPRPDPTWRGLFVFATSDPTEARAWTDSDPAIAAGALAARTFPLRADRRLRRLPGIDAALLAELPADRRDAPGATARAFTLVLGPEITGETDRTAVGTALAPLARTGQLCTFGWLGGPGEPPSSWRPVWIAADETPRATRSRLDESGLAAPGWQTVPWFASRALTQLGSREE